MKIAVLLRGQPRFSEQGAKLFNKFVRDRFPEHEFSIFIASWKTISNVMEKPHDPNDKIYGREYDQTLLSYDDTIKLIKPWGPRKFSITPEYNLFDILKDTYTELLSSKNKEKYDALTTLLMNESLNGKNLLLPGHLDVIFESKEFLVSNILWGNKIELSDPVYELKRNMINNQYLLGQIYSAGKSYTTFKEYSEEFDYCPDLIWSTRPDAIHWFNSHEGFNIIKKDLERIEKEKKYPNIFVDKVEIHNGKPWASDYNFYMLPETAHHSFDDINQKIRTWILEDTLSMLSVIGSGPALQHVLWTNFLRNCNIMPLFYNIKEHSSLIRPKQNIDQLIATALESPTELKTFKWLLKEIINEYTYPAANTPVPPDIIDKYYEMLSKN